MDMKSNHNSPVLTDPVPLSKSRLGLPSNITPYSPVSTPYSTSSLYLQIPRRKSGKLDDVRATGWLDAMKASSPPRKKLMNKDITSESQPDETDAVYHTWMVYEFVRLSELHYAGSHGMDIMGRVRESESVDDHPGCISTTDEQVELTCQFVSSSIHVMWEEVGKRVFGFLKGFPRLRVTHGRKVEHKL
ncbi:hypothetical protein BHE74_00048747 [Ensete ventricosum]|nr:hypothetical protein GW17_00047657 [Ensete ventricosum]RWW45417.1 hypothetical protein BHE74_00048747 [Ensete ventricosum]RZR90323.1 hypothetical protein BHM03_00018182 [Ensete ventricosum]